MMNAFNEDNPEIALNSLSDASHTDEQKGYRFIFAGTMAGMRNPRAHNLDFTETIDECLDHLSIASALMRKLDGAIKWTIFLRLFIRETQLKVSAIRLKRYQTTPPNKNLDIKS